MPNATIIILNAAGSVGKSSTAKAFQRSTARPFLHVQGDAYLNMFPQHLWNGPEGVRVETDPMSGQIVNIDMGSAIHRLLRGMRSSVAALAREGNDLIVDDIMLGEADQRDYRSRLVGERVYFVGLHAPLPVAEQRERDRGDRYIGLSRWQAARIHRGIDYDLEIDTSENDPTACARIIAEALGIATN